MAKKEQFIFEAPKKEKPKSSKKTAVFSLLLVTFLTILSLVLSLYSAGEGDIQKGNPSQHQSFPVSQLFA